MGIPKYFRHITGKYPTVVKNVDTKVQIQNLYFDMNCLIHPCVRTVSKEHPHLLISTRSLNLWINIRPINLFIRSLNLKFITKSKTT